MTRPNPVTGVVQSVQTLLGGLVVLVTVPTGVGPAVGGWLAGRRTQGPVRGALLGGLAGLLGSLPWATLVYLASAGAFEPVGYHRGVVHVGINTAAPGTFVLWQEVALAGLVAGTLVGLAVLGGLTAGLSEDLVGALRDELSTAG